MKVVFGKLPLLLNPERHGFYSDTPVSFRSAVCGAHIYVRLQNPESPGDFGIKPDFLKVPIQIAGSSAKSNGENWRSPKEVQRQNHHGPS